MTKSQPNKANRVENVLAFMAAGVIAVSILSIFAVIALAANKANDVLPYIVMLPLIGLPTGALLIIALVIVSARRRKLENQ